MQYQFSERKLEQVKHILKPSSERKGGHEVVEGACETSNFTRKVLFRALLQSLRDSSLSEGAFKVSSKSLCLAYGISSPRESL